MSLATRRRTATATATTTTSTRMPVSKIQQKSQQTIQHHKIVAIKFVIKVIEVRYKGNKSNLEWGIDKYSRKTEREREIGAIFNKYSVI